MDSKPPLQSKPLRRKVHVVYYLSRGGQMDQPHLLEGYLTAVQDGLRLRDFKRWLAALRGKSMPTSFAWSYKRNYKSGFIWHDLGDNDLIQPLCKNEYVLMGSEIVRDLGMAHESGKCKCGGVQQIERKTGDRVDAEVQGAPMNTRSTVMSSPKMVNKITLSSPKLVNKSTSHLVDQTNNVDVARQCRSLNNSGRLIVSSSEANQYHDNNKTISKDTASVSRVSSSRNFDLTAQTLLEEVKMPTNHIAPKHVAVTGNRTYGMIQSSTSSSMRDCEIMADDQEALVMLELTTDNHIVHQELHEVEREQWKGNGAKYMKSASPMYRSRGVYHDSINSGMTDDVDDHIYQDDEISCTNIVDASTQTGDSTRCSTDRQESISSHGGSGFDNVHMIELVCGPAGSTMYSDWGMNGYIVGDGSTIKRVSSAGKPRGNLSKQLSKDISNLPDLEKAVMININCSNLSADEINPAPGNHLVPCSNTLTHNNIGSPALSTCSAMSARSTRFAREENYTRSAPKPMKPEHHHHHGGKGSSNLSTSAPSSAPTLLKQFLTCGNADDDVKGDKPSSGLVIMNGNALSAMQTPCRGATDTNEKRGGRNSNVWTCKPGIMKRNVSTSSDNRSVISATASDTLELVSSPDSVHSNGRMKSIMRSKSSVSSLNIAGTSVMPLSRGEAAPTRGQQLRLSNTANATSATSPCSSTSRRSSIRENDISGDMEGFMEAMRGHNGATSLSPKMRTNKGNRNALSIGGILHDQSRDKRIESSSMMQNKRGGQESSASAVSELHKLICNPPGTPTPKHCSQVITANLTNVSLEQTPIRHYHCHHTCDGLSSSNKPQPQSQKILLTPHDHSTARTPTRPTAATLHLPPSTILSKSFNISPCSSTFLQEASRRPSSSYISSWKDLLWSPRYHSSNKEKDKRRMKP